MILASSCQDFLEPDSISTFDTNYVYSNVDDARRGVNAIYTAFMVDGFRSRLSNNMTGNTDIEHSSGWTSSGDRYQIWNLNALASNGDLRQFWNAAYQGIRDANIAIEGIEASEGIKSSDVATVRTMYHLLGEAYTLRAYWYSMLVYYFGDVPNVREAPKAGIDFFLPKEDRNVILSQCIEDLIDIEGQMKWADEVNYGIEQVNREYTLGMIARLSLQRGGYFLKPDLTMERPSDYLEYYQLARDYTQKLMDLKDRPLPTDFRQIFMNQCKFISPVNDEILFEVPFAIGNGDVGWNIGITVQGGATASHSYGSGGNYMAIPPSFYFSYDTTDLRRDVSCGLYRINTSFEKEFVSGPTNISQGKWSRHFLDTPPGPSTAKGTGINWPMMRYADVLLMFAEAENELNGPTGAAQEALARVRRR
ncbi:MAG: RagB/SusD family nutrient uptake outer membrane protein, partial [Lewinella sp.]|nr:RagB/SusD family nutrient uptake outer membrane protein [Lewinella sp.]